VEILYHLLVFLVGVVAEVLQLLVQQLLLQVPVMVVLEEHLQLTEHLQQELVGEEAEVELLEVLQ
jgi:hypothetical protein